MASPTPRRFLLRERTAAAHAELDAMVGEWRNAAEYRAYVAGLAGFRLPVEAMLARVTWPPAFGDWRPLLIADALRTDAEQVGIAPAVLEEIPAPTGGAGLIGLLYVLEGSSLGARVLIRRAAELGFTADDGAAHLAILAGSVDNWRLFLTQLETRETFDVEAAVVGALDAFQRAQRAFERSPDALAVAQPT